MDEARRTLLTQATLGDEDAIGRLLEEYLPRVRAFVRLQMNPGLRVHEATTDIVQSVCVDLLRRQEGFEYRGEAAFRSWLFQAALNKVREKQRFWLRDKRDVRRDQQLRMTRSSSDASLHDFYATLGTPSQDLAAKEHMAELEAAFDSLPEHYREVVTLARIVGLPHDEIAKKLDKTVGAVRQILGRALVKLGETISE